MSTRTAYHWHPDSRVFVATSEELESPLEPGVFYPPGDATFDPPPAVPAGQRAVRDASNTAWVLEAIPAPPAATSPVPPDPSVPASVTPLQAFTALENVGLLAQVDAYMNDPSTPLLVRRAYLVATEWRRNSLLVMNAAIVLNLTPEQVDDLFRAAAAIEV